MMASSSSWSSPSATNRVEKATSEFLIGPDWTMNIDICDAINSSPGFAKDVVKAVKKRLQHKNPKVQLLALTLLEAMVKNCGDYVHFQIAERNVLQEMTKIVKKKADMHVRDKILTLLDAWQEAFGGPGGKHAQYYWAYDELRRIGVQFPQRSLDTAPIFTPPVSHPTQGSPQPGYGMPSNSSTRLDEAMAAEMENLSVSDMNSMQNALDLLDDMLQAVNPSERTAVKDEVIIDLVERCRANQKKLMQMLTTTGDEELLGQGLELNDSLQSVLAKHDAVASGSPLPTQMTNHKPNVNEVDSGLKPAEVRALSLTSEAKTSPPVGVLTSDPVEEEEEEDDFALLARRHSKTQSTVSTGSGESILTVNADTNTASSTSAAEPSLSNALSLPNPPPPVKTTKEQDMIDFLSLALTTTTTTSPHTPQTPAAPVQNMHQAPVSPDPKGHPYASEAYSAHQGQASFNNYIAPWAQPQPQPQFQTHTHTGHQSRFQPQTQLQFQHQTPPPSQFQPETLPQFKTQTQPPSPFQGQSQPQYQPQTQTLSQSPSQSQYPQYSSGYPPPPWAATPGYSSYQNHMYTSPPSFSTTQANTSYTSFGARALQHVNSFPVSNGLAMNGEAHRGSNPVTTGSATGQKPFIPSYRLFEDLNVLGNGDGRYKMTSNPSPSLLGSSNQSMVGGRK